MPALRNASLDELMGHLHMLEMRKVDAVVEVRDLSMEAAHLRADDLSDCFRSAPETDGGTELRLSRHAHGQLAARLSIPRTYYHKVRVSDTDLLDDNVNHWLRAEARNDSSRKANIMLRMLRPQPGESHPTIRGVLSDRYRIIDDFDIVAACHRVVSERNMEIAFCDRAEHRMMLRLESDIEEVDASELMRHTEDLSGDAHGQQTVARAGLVITNSELGQANFSIEPRIQLEPAGIALIPSADAFRQRHAGSQYPLGQVDFSDAHQQQERAWIASQIEQAVDQFGSREYVQEVIDDTTQYARELLEHPRRTLQEAAAHMGISEEGTEEVMEIYLSNADQTQFGAARALLEWAQAAPNMETQYAIESDVLNLLPRLARMDREVGRR